MLNKVILMGRLTADPELRQTPGNVSVLQFNVAVDRNFVAQSGERETDFITCVAWRQTAEFVNKYFKKGDMIAVEGNLRTRNYDDKNGVKHYMTEVYVDSVYFCGSKNGNANGNANRTYTAPDPYRNSAPAPAEDAFISIGDESDFQDLNPKKLPF